MVETLWKWCRYRPVKWPPKGPYWCSGSGDDYSIVVAYVPRDVDVTEFWPEASHLDEKDVDSIAYSGRFPKPEWWDADESEGE